MIRDHSKNICSGEGKGWKDYGLLVINGFEGGVDFAWTILAKISSNSTFKTLV